MSSAGMEADRVFVWQARQEDKVALQFTQQLAAWSEQMHNLRKATVCKIMECKPRKKKWDPVTREEIESYAQRDRVLTEQPEL